MPGELVVDASVAAKCFLPETGSEAALALIRSGAALIAPEVVLVELASIAAKKVRRDDLSSDVAEIMVAKSHLLFDELSPTAPLIDRAFRLACAYPLSLYDGLYLALAEQRGAVFVTSDAKLERKATAAKSKARVQLLA